MSKCGVHGLFDISNDLIAEIFSPLWVFMDTCSLWVSWCDIPHHGFSSWLQFLTPFQWFPTFPLDLVSIPFYFGSHQPAAVPGPQKSRDFGDFFQGPAQGKCHRKHRESKGESPGSASKHPAWRRFKSERIKGGLTGSRRGSQAKQERLPKLLCEPEAPSYTLNFPILVLIPSERQQGEVWELWNIPWIPWGLSSQDNPNDPKQPG